MLKHEMIKDVAERTQQTQAVVRSVLEAALASTLSAVFNGEDVMLLGLGKLKVRTRRAAMSRNPRTGASVVTPARQVAVLRPSATLVDCVNGWPDGWPA